MEATTKDAIQGGAEAAPTRFREPVAMDDGIVVCADGSVWELRTKYAKNGFIESHGWVEVAPIPGSRAAYEQRPKDGPF